MKKKALFFTTLVSFAMAITSCTGTDSPATPSGPELDHIAITQLPEKREYTVGENLDLTGMKVTAYYDDESTKVVRDYTTSGYDKTTAGTQTITVTYMTKTDSFTVKVSEPKQEYALSYMVNSGSDMSSLDLTQCNLPTKALEGSTVTIKVAPASGYTYVGFFPNAGAGVPDSFYDQFADMTLTESEFSFVMPKGTVSFNFTTRQGEVVKHKFTFDTVQHLTFRYAWNTEEDCEVGQPVEFTVTPDYGYVLDGEPFVKGDASIAISKNKNDVYSFTMPDKDVVVSCKVKEEVKATYTVTAGTVANATIKKFGYDVDWSAVEKDILVKFTVTVAENYELDGKPFIVGDSSISVSEYSSLSGSKYWGFNMPEKNVTISCNVKSTGPVTTKYTVTLNKVEHASIGFSGTSQSQYEVGAQVKFYVTPDSGYEISGLPFAVNDDSLVIEVASTNVYKFTMPERNVTISATVVEKAVEKYSVTFDTVAHVTFSNASSLDLTQVPAGSTVVFTAVADEGYKLNGKPTVSDESVVVSASTEGLVDTYQFTMPSGNVTVSASVSEYVAHTVTFAEIANVTFELVNPTVNPCLPNEPFKFTVTCPDGVSIATGPYIVEDNTIQVKTDQFGAYFFVMPDFDVTVSLTTSGSPKVLDHISVQNPKTKYDVDDEFVKPTVYAYYTSGSFDDVSRDSNLRFSGYNMSVAGDYTVTVTYAKNGLTVSTTYDITVNEKQTSYSVVTNKPYEFYTSNTKVVTYRFMFFDDGTGYYQKDWKKSDGAVLYQVNFTYIISENVLRATFSSYETGSEMTSFSNPYKIFADGFSDYQSIDLSIYDGSVSGYLLSVSSDTVRKATSATVFHLVEE